MSTEDLKQVKTALDLVSLALRQCSPTFNQDVIYNLGQANITLSQLYNKCLKEHGL